jgi:hypothetical protein
LEFGQQLVERLLIGDRPIQDRLDGFGRGRQSLEHKKYRVTDAALDPDLIVGCHARPSLFVLHHAQVWEARHIRERRRFTSTIGGAMAGVFTRSR